MKITAEWHENVLAITSERELDVGEPVLLVHLSQKLDYASRGIAMAFTQVEVGALRRLLARRMKEVNVEQRYAEAKEVADLKARNPV